MVRLSSTFVHKDSGDISHTVDLFAAGVFVHIPRETTLTTCFYFLKSPIMNHCLVDGEETFDFP